MAQYAIAFDVDTKAAKAAGLTENQVTQIYKEIGAALALAGFTGHPQGSLYHTEAEQDPIAAIMKLQTAIRNNAPKFCQWVRRVHVFRMEEWSDVTPLLASRPAGPVSTEAETAEQQGFAWDEAAG